MPFSFSFTHYFKFVKGLLAERCLHYYLRCGQTRKGKNQMHKRMPTRSTKKHQPYIASFFSRCIHINFVLIFFSRSGRALESHVTMYCIPYMQHLDTHNDAYYMMTLTMCERVKTVSLVLPMLASVCVRVCMCMDAKKQYHFEGDLSPWQTHHRTNKQWNVAKIVENSIEVYQLTLHVTISEFIVVGWTFVPFSRQNYTPGTFAGNKTKKLHACCSWPLLFIIIANTKWSLVWTGLWENVCGIRVLAPSRTLFNSVVIVD